MENYIAALEKKGVQLSQVMSKDFDFDKIAEIEKKVKAELPEAFKNLYSKYNGEKSDFGFMAGLEMLSIDKVLFEYNYFRKNATELEAVGTESISDKPSNKCQWIPFAHDGSRCFLVVDMSPAKKGKKGQILGLDLEYDTVYLFANSLEEMFAKMTSWVNEGKFVIKVEGDDTRLEEVTGHLFNGVNDYAIMSDVKERVDVEVSDEFWLNRYAKQIKKNKDGKDVISSTALSKESGTFRIMYQKKTTDISCVPMQYFENVKEIVIHDAVLRDFDCLCKMSNLTTIFLVNCEIQGSDVSELARVEKLKRLHLVNTGDSDSIRKLAGMKSLKELYIAKLENFDSSIFGEFTGLTSLDLSGVDCNDYGFLTKLTKLKELKLGRKELENLDFLSALTKLESFELLVPAKNETGLASIKDMKKLKEFKYPVKDLTVYQGMSGLKEIGIFEENNERYDVFEGMAINSFLLVCIKEDKGFKKTNAVNKKLSKYLSITCSSSTSLE